MSTALLKSKVKIVDTNPYKTPDGGRFHAIQLDAFDLTQSAYTCREEFAYDFLDRKPTSFLFQAKKAEHLDLIVKMFNYIQNKLKLSKEDRVRFVQTEKDTVIGIRVSSWWNQYKVRRELLTALFRAALCKGKTNEEKIKNCEYLDNGNNSLRKAFDRFMDGFTKLSLQEDKYLSGEGGWQFYFQGDDYYDEDGEDDSNENWKNLKK